MRVRTLLPAVALCVASLTAFQADAKSTSVHGYTKKNGTYVAPHTRTAPNSTKTDNYSTKGNSNPYTGKAGTVDPNKAKVTPATK